ESGAVLLDELGKAVVHVAPLLAGGDGLEVCGRDLDLDFEVALVAGVDDGAVGLTVAVHTVGTDEEPGGVFDRFDRGGEADAGRALLAYVVEAGAGELLELGEGGLEVSADVIVQGLEG